MKSKDLYRWIDHRATMLWVCLKCLVWLTIGVALVVAIDPSLPSGVNCAINRRCWNRILPLVRSVWRSHGYCNDAKRHGRRPQRERVRRELCEGTISCPFRIDDIGDARHPGDAHHHVEVVTTSTLCELACSVILNQRVTEQALIQSSSKENSPSAPSARMIPIVVTF